MKKNLERVIEIPEGVEVLAEDGLITVKGNGKELKRELNLTGVSVKIDGKELKIFAKNATKRESKLMGTAWAHIKNMIAGAQEDFVYKLEIANVHFPMNVKAENGKVVIKSFLGETTERTAEILKDVSVDVKGNVVEVKSANIEAAGQTAANIEKATKLYGRDRRIFQDGIFITEKPGRVI
ncbi:50S ribosomal protein L6 [Candidatus Pacearchaeota archaeon]|nr:50S ribosomal protein L6 [Candidatus Pacearchaeota archaeon]|tara:strand:+ start:5369 stop:5911 length:543 start_codon:yes stop_codon:yes gene_type:complete